MRYQFGKARNTAPPGAKRKPVMHLNMSTAELVRYGLMYSDALPAPVSREALERLDDAQAELEAMRNELDAVQNAIDLIGLAGTPANRLEAACEAVAMRCDQAERLEQLIFEVARKLESGRMNKAELEALATTIYNAIQ